MLVSLLYIVPAFILLMSAYLCFNSEDGFSSSAWERRLVSCLVGVLAFIPLLNLIALVVMVLCVCQSRTTHKQAKIERSRQC